MNFEIDHSLTTFTSEGKLNQCENAIKASQSAPLAIACTSKDGGVMAVLKMYPPLVEKHKVSKISKICTHISMTYAGMHPDYRIIEEKACIIAENYKEVYGKYPYIDVFVMNLCRVIQEYTQKGGFRPFGCCLLVMGYKSDGTCALYSVEPSGSFLESNVYAIGKDAEGAIKFVETRRENLDDNIVSLVKALREFAGTTITYEDVDVSVLREEVVVMNQNGVKEIFDSIDK